MARRTASAKWAAGPALDGRRATLLGLGLNEGLGCTGGPRWVEYVCMSAILADMLPVNKSSRGTPRLRRAPRAWICFFEQALSATPLFAETFMFESQLGRPG